MQRAIIALILIIIAIAAFLFFKSASPEPAVSTSPKAVMTPNPDQATLAPEKEAQVREVIQTLAKETEEQVIEIHQADNFVTGDQLLAIPNMDTEAAQVEIITQEKLTTHNSQAVLKSRVTPQTITLPQPKTTSPVTVSPTPKSAVSTQAIAPTQIIVTKKTTSPESSITESKPVQNTLKRIETLAENRTLVVQKPIFIEDSAIEEPALVNPVKTLAPGDKIRLKELLSNPDLEEGTVFYIHAVTQNDTQGIWGILQRGLTNTFREGVQLNQNQGKALVTDIPALADEPLDDLRSSFLGDFLYSKVNDIHIYNYEQGMLGQDPDLIKPGQQLIIVRYTEAELLSIYKHFNGS